MNFEEYAAKPLLADAGIAVPPGQLATNPAEARQAAEKLGPCMVKAQVPTGKRGKAGGIAKADTPDSADEAARRILGMEIGGFTVEKLLIEQQSAFDREMYAAILNDPDSKGPLILFSAEGGMDIEELADAHPDKLMRLPVDIRHPLKRETLTETLPRYGVPKELIEPAADLLLKLYDVYLKNDADLVEINPLVAIGSDMMALDCKFSLDESAIKRQEALAAKGVPEKLTDLEARGKDIGVKYIELDGSVGLLANGAGLTMTTMDVISHHGGKPSNFLEIGGEAYTLGKPALELVLANPNVKALVVNFCGAFARTDVMTEGIVEAWAELNPDKPVFFSIHGTGEDEAQAMVRERLGIEPHDLMDDAIKAAIEAAR